MEMRLSGNPEAEGSGNMARVVHHTVAVVVDAAEAKSVHWPLESEVSNEERKRILFPEKQPASAHYVEVRAGLCNYPQISSQARRDHALLGKNIVLRTMRIATLHTSQHSLERSTGAGRV